MEKIAVISDVHGNLPALEVVLADIKRRGIELIYNLGDLVGKGPSSAQTVDMCREICQVIVRGNWDDGIGQQPEYPTDVWYSNQLGEARLAFIHALPNVYDFRLSGKHVRLYHASAQSEHHRVHPGSGNEALRAMFDNTAFTGFENPVPDIVAYGDIHAIYLLPIDISDRSHTLFNAGSVGNPLDFPQATYVVLTGVLDGQSPAPYAIEFVRLPYNVEATIEQARQVGLPGLEAYTIELRTAVYQRGRRR